MIPAWVPTGAAMYLDFVNDRSWTDALGEGTVADLISGNQNFNYRGVGNAITPLSNALPIGDRGLYYAGFTNNKCIYSRDFTQADWVVSSAGADLTIAKDAVGMDGVANAASSITCDVSGGTVTFTHTAASSTFSCSVYIKRVTGAGTVRFSHDGSTWQDVTSDLASDSWYVAWTKNTLANPQIVIEMQTVGDVIEVDFATIGTNTGNDPGLPIETTGSSKTGNSGDITFDDIAWYADGAAGTFVVSVETDVNDMGALIRPTISASQTSNSWTVMADRAEVYASGVQEFIIGFTDPSVRALHKIACALDTDDMERYLDGASLGTDTSGALLSGVDLIKIGKGRFNSAHTNGWIREITYYASRLADADAISLTSFGVEVNVGLAAETDTALGAAPSKTLALGLASETDAALGAAPSKTLALGLVAEADTALGATPSKTIALGLAAETDTALGAAPSKTLALGLAAETDTALGASASKTLALGIAAESDAALGASASKTVPLGLAAETDTALGASASKTIALGIAAETDTAFALAGELGIASETDTALGATASKTLALAIASETDAALGAAPSKTLALGLAAETDAALGASASKTIALGLAAETDAALGAAATKTVALGIASETDAALSLGSALGVAAETDTALGAAASKTIPLGLAVETDTALGAAASKTIALGLASETDAALAARASKTIALGLASETDAALGAAPSKTLALGLAAETDSALGATAAAALTPSAARTLALIAGPRTLAAPARARTLTA